MSETEIDDRGDIGLKRKCLRCGWEWRQRLPERPRACPNPSCRSPWWDRLPRPGNYRRKAATGRGAAGGC